jgi:hypothetical protein
VIGSDWPTREKEREEREEDDHQGSGQAAGRQVTVLPLHKVNLSIVSSLQAARESTLTLCYCYSWRRVEEDEMMETDSCSRQQLHQLETGGRQTSGYPQPLMLDR